jgi:hypothetical protein
MIDPVPGGDGIDGHEHSHPGGEEVEDGLTDTDMGLEPADDDRADLCWCMRYNRSLSWVHQMKFRYLKMLLSY